MLCCFWTGSFQGQPGINGRPGIEGLEVIRHDQASVSHMTESTAYSVSIVIESKTSKEQSSVVLLIAAVF